MQALKPSGLAVSFSLIFLTLYIIFDAIYGDAIKDWSASLTESWQSSRNQLTTRIYSFPSWFVSDVVYFVVLISIWIVDDNKNRAIRFYTYALFSVKLSNWLKLIYIGPRPFMEVHNILAIQCELDFGRPSGHALASLTFYSLLYLYLLEFFGVKH